MADKSKLAEILGVEEDEEFAVTVKGSDDIVYRIHKGERQYKDALGRWHSECSENTLTALINDPSLIRRKPRFSDEEMTFLRLLHKYGKVYEIGVGNCGGAYDFTDNDYPMIENISKSLNLKETIDLNELFKEEEDG